MKVMGFMSVISALMKETPESSLASSSMDTGRRGLSGNQETGSHQDTKSAAILPSDHSLQNCER